MEDNHHWNYRQQALASILFDKTIDPIVRRLILLDDLRRQTTPLQQHTNNGNNNNNNNDTTAAAATTRSSSSELGLELERRNQVKQLLQTLRTALDEIIETVHIKKEEITSNNNNTSGHHDEVDNNDAKQYWQSRVQNQINGIAVPLFSMLRQHQPSQWYNPTNNTDDDGRMHYILQSAAYSCTEEAALCTILVWKCRQICVNTFGNCIDHEESNDGNNDMKSLVLPGLVSCAMALSSLDIANDENDKGTKKSSVNMNEKALDRGEECAVAILRCMQAFLTSSSPLKQIDLDSLPSDLHGHVRHLSSPMATEIGDAMGGALVARLVQTCLALLRQDSDAKEESNENNNGSNSKKDNATLQLEALKTLQVLMTGIPIDTLWKAILPGCFAGLYRCALSKLRYSSSASTHKVASDAILALSLLLMQSMKKTNTYGSVNESSLSVTETLLAAVQKSKLSVENQDLTNDDTNMVTSVQSDKHDLEFDNEVNSRLPGPLSVLLSLVSTNRSHLVRQRGLFLCRIILVETRTTWTESTSITLGKKALEYCLTVLTDEKDKLSQFSLQVINEYKSQIGAFEWKRRLSTNSVPTILELVEMLPILAKSGKDVEVRNYLRIIDGYLLISFRGEKNLTLGKGKSDIGAALSCADAAKVITDAFSVIFAPDSESMTCRPVVEAFSTDGNEVGIIGDHNRLRFLYLQDETIAAARQTVRLIARTFGTKRCAFMIDACIADMFESCSRKSQLSHTPGGISSQLAWSGSCVYSTELLGGLLKLYEHGDRGRASKNAKKNAHVLSSLAGSVFPIIVSDPLWTLPTTQDGHVSGKKWQKNSNGLQFAMVDNIRGDVVCEAFSTTVMNANAIVLCALMGFVCQFARVLDHDVKLHLPTILLPLLERASSIGNHSYVQNFAVASLGVISKSAGCSDMYSFIATNFDYLLDAVSIRLRKHARERSIMQRSMMGVIDVVLRSTIRHENIASGAVSSHLSMVDHMLTCLLNYFDRQYEVFLSQQSYLDAVCVFRSIITFVDETIIEQTDNPSSKALESHVREANENDWLRRLDDELQLGPTSYSEYCDEDPINEPNTEEDGSSRPNLNDEHIAANESSKYVKEIHTLNAVLARCSYLICAENLKIQIMGCETILAGFGCLWKIGSFRTSNPLLPAIAELWPTIIRRLRAASSAHISSRRKSRQLLPIRHAMAKDQDQTLSQTSLEALISECLEIISQLCFLSDGFFSDRFENDVYPILARLLEPDERGNVLLEDGRHSIDAKRHSLLLSVLLCLKHAYESSCGQDLAGLIPSCGSLILPLLSEDHVGDAAVDTIKAMLKIDSDSLWRGLYKLSGCSFPRNPLRTIPHCSSNSVSLSVRTIGIDSIAAKQNAEKLLYFIDTLPEQQL